MKPLFYIVAGAGVLLAASTFTKPATAQQAYGGGYNNIWSSAQGTSDGYGNANAYDMSTSGALATAGGGGLSGTSGGFIGGGITSAFTTSTAATNSSGSGYAQAQTSGYAGGTVSGYGGRGH